MSDPVATRRRRAAVVGSSAPLGARRKDANGQILVLFAFVLVALLAVSALAVDYGGWLLARRTYQNVADAAALAGASQLTTPITDPCPVSGGTKNFCAREAAWQSVGDALHLAGLVPSSEAAGTSAAPYTEAGFSIWVSSPPADSNTACSTTPSCKAVFPACKSPSYPPASCPYPGSVSSQMTVFVRVERHQDANLSRIVLPAGQQVSAWATAGRIPQNYAFVGLCYPAAPRIGADCHTGSGEDVTVNGANSTLVLQSGDLGVNTWAKTTGSGAAIALAPSSGAYMGDFSTCWGNTNNGQCKLLTWNDPPGARGGPRSAIPLGPRIEDPQYPEPPINSTTVPWQCGGSGGIAALPGVDGGVPVAGGGTSPQLVSYIQPAPTPGTLLATATSKGTVTDASLGGNLSGARVEAFNSANVSVGFAITGATGSYSISIPVAGNYTITASKLNYVTQSTVPPLAFGSNGIVNQDFALVGNPGTLSGTVKDASTNVGIVGANVTVTGGNSTVTGLGGAYTILIVQAGLRTVTATAAGYTPLVKTVTMPPGGPATLNFLMGLTGSIGGTVTDSVSFAAIIGATVSIAGGIGSTVTIAGGQYIISGIPAGTYTVNFSASGYTSATTNNVVVAVGATTTVNKALAPTGGFVSGTVTDQTTGLPISGATVQVTGGGASTTTNASGAYTLALTAGTYGLTATAPGYLDGTAINVRVRGGLTTTQDFALWPSTCDPANNQRGSWLCASCPAVTSPAGGDVRCSSYTALNRIRPGTYDNITIPSDTCAFIDPVPPGGLPVGQMAGIVHVQGTLSIGSNAFLFGDGVTIVVDQGATVSVNNSGGFVLNYATKWNPSPAPNGSCDYTTPELPSDGKCFRNVPGSAGGFHDGNDYSYGAWAVDIKTKAAVQPWANCGSAPTPTYNTSCFSAGVIGITWYLRGSGGNTHRFDLSGLMGFLFKGILYGPKDNIGIGGQGDQASAGQIIGWTITYSGGTKIYHRYNGIQVDGPPYLIEPFLGQ